MSHVSSVELRFSQRHGSRALFGILINSPDVRSNDAEADQINASEENNRQDNWGISGHLNSSSEPRPQEDYGKNDRYQEPTQSSTLIDKSENENEESAK
jgi:hypothetical protein